MGMDRIPRMELLPNLYSILFQQKLLKINGFMIGLKMILSNFEDYSCDCPQLELSLINILTPLLCNNLLNKDDFTIV